MKTENRNLNHITDHHALFPWLIDRLEETGPFLAITEEADRHCDRFISALAEHRPILFVPLTTNSLMRLKATEGSLAHLTSPRSARRSVALIRFLGVIGSILEGFPNAKMISWCDIVAFAVTAWTDSNKYLVFQMAGGFRSWRLLSSARGTLAFNVLIDVELNPEIYELYSDRKFWDSIDDEEESGFVFTSRTKTLSASDLAIS